MDNNEKQPKFSVIIPAHNAEKHIGRGLDSIVNQSFKDYELIVVCDACTDRTEEIARKSGARIIRTDYGLDGMARNAGIDAARGEWILFMDDDDWFLHEFVFQQLAEVVGQHDEDILMFSFIWRWRGYAHYEGDQYYIAVWSKCWRREFIGDTRFPDTPYWSDVEFNEKMFAKEPRVVRWDMPMYYYNYLREGSISWRKEMGEIE